MSISPLKFVSFFGNSLIAAAIILWTRISSRRLPVPIATSSVDILGIAVNALTNADVMQQIDQFVQSKTPHHIFTADASGIMSTQQNQELRAIVQQADIVTADGSGVMLAAHLRRTALPERVSGVDLVEQISHLAARRGYSAYFFGAADGVAAAAASALQRRNPTLRIAGTRHGYFNAAEESSVVQEIAATTPDILFVALGIPKQEYFIRHNFYALNVPVMIGIGGSLDVISGQLARAPKWMQRCGLEWLYRLYQQPGRLPRMYVLPKFVIKAWQARK